MDFARRINELELMGALYAIQVFTAKVTAISVRIYLDNMTAVEHINHVGGTRSVDLTKLVGTLTEWYEGRNIDLAAVYQGKLNVVADKEFRAGPDASD